MLKKIALLVLMMGLASPIFAVSIRGGVANISSTDAAVLGTTAGLGCRIYSVFGTETGINLNTASTVPACLNNRCPSANYATLGGFGTPGGYLCNQEDVNPYNSNADGQVFYELVDDEIFPGLSNHAAYFAVQGQLTSASAGNPGDFRQAGCPGTTLGNCFLRADSSNSRTTPITGVRQGYQAAHDLGSIGGLSPVPVVKVDFSPSNGCAAGQAKLTWDEPETYAAAMRNGVASPVQGVKIYKSGNTCDTAPSGDVAAGGWVPLSPTSFFALGSGAAGVCTAITADSWFAMTVVVKGPGSAPSQIETGIVGGAGFVGANSQCVATSPTASRIQSVTARYAGRGSVNVNFTSGSEAGVSGFYVQRASSPGGPWTRVSDMIATKGDSSTYMSSDKVRAGLGKVLYYNVQVVMNDGSTLDSGASAVTLPATQRKLNPGN